MAIYCDDVINASRPGRPAIPMKRGSRAWKKQGNQRWKWRKKKLRRRKKARREAR